MRANHIHYHVVICDMHAYDHRLRNQGQKTTSVSKTYYQLLLHRCCRLYGGKAFIHVRPDTGACTRELPGLRNGLNADAQRRFDLKLRTVLSINLTESITVNLMQMNDVILGAIASHRNERHKRQGASPHKTRIAEAVRAVFGVPNFTINTSWNHRRLYGVELERKNSGALSPRSKNCSSVTASLLGTTPKGEVSAPRAATHIGGFR
jgi:hypothetical protein